MRAATAPAAVSRPLHNSCCPALLPRGPSCYLAPFSLPPKIPYVNRECGLPRHQQQSAGLCNSGRSSPSTSGSRPARRSCRPARAPTRRRAEVQSVAHSSTRLATAEATHELTFGDGRPRRSGLSPGLEPRDRVTHELLRRRRLDQARGLRVCPCLRLPHWHCVRAGPSAWRGRPHAATHTHTRSRLPRCCFRTTARAPARQCRAATCRALAATAATSNKAPRRPHWQQQQQQQRRAGAGGGAARSRRAGAPRARAARRRRRGLQRRGVGVEATQRESGCGFLRGEGLLSAALRCPPRSSPLLSPLLAAAAVRAAARRCAPLRAAARRCAPLRAAARIARLAVRDAPRFST